MRMSLTRHPRKFSRAISQIILTRKNSALILSILLSLSLIAPTTSTAQLDPDLCLGLKTIRNTSQDGPYTWTDVVLPNTPSLFNTNPMDFQFFFFVYSGNTGDIISGHLTDSSGNTVYFQYELSSPGRNNQSTAIHTIHLHLDGLTINESSNTVTIAITGISDTSRIGGITLYMFQHINAAECYTETTGDNWQSSLTPFSIDPPVTPIDPPTPTPPQTRLANATSGAEPCFMGNLTGMAYFQDCGFDRDWLQAIAGPWLWATGGYILPIVMGLLIYITWLRTGQPAYPIIVGSMFLGSIAYLFPTHLVTSAIMLAGLVVGIMLYTIVVKQSDKT